MKLLKGFALASLLTPIFISYSHANFVECVRNKSNFKQFCFLKENDFDGSEQFKIAPTIGGTKQDLTDLFNNPVFVVQNMDNGPEDVNLTGLHPLVSLEVNFSESEPCLRSALWNDGIQLQMRNRDTQWTRNAGAISHGDGLFTFDIHSMIQSGDSPLEMTRINDNLNIAAAFSLVNPSHQSNRPLAYQRIPNDCGLSVSNLEISFNPLDLEDDLSMLKIYIQAMLETMTDKLIIHRNRVDSANQFGQCNIHNMAQTFLLKEQDIMFNFDLEYNDMSYMSKWVLANAIIDAVTRNTIDESLIPEASLNPNPTIDSDGFESFETEYNPDYFDYLLTPDFENYVAQNCSSTSPDYSISRDPFVEVTMVDGEEVITVNDNVGYLNYLKYEQARTNLMNAAKFAFLISEVSKTQIDNYTQPSWLNSGAIVSEF